jgi:ABC-type nickel/cobalt efflux system permease component RcnA
MRPLLVALGAAFVLVLGSPWLASDPAGAHPLGNFTINHFDGLDLRADGLILDLVTDMAEIPSYQARRDMDANNDGDVSEQEASTWAEAQCRDQTTHVSLQVDKAARPMQVVEAAVISFPPGQAGLATTRLECRARTDLPSSPGPHELSYRDTNFDGRLGWRELVARSETTGVLLSSDVPAESVTDRLTRYPTNLLQSPLEQTAASVRYDGAALAASTAHRSDRSAGPRGPSTILPRGVDRATNNFTALVAKRHLTVAFGAFALGLAAMLGAIHALAPGHGKTVMAAYLVGQRESLRQATVVGLTVTATHTLGVLALGALLASSTFVTPEKLYPWLGLASGLLLAGVGLTLLRRARAFRRLTSPTPPLACELRRTPQPAVVLVGAVAAQSAGHGQAGPAQHGHDHNHAHRVDQAHADEHSHAHTHDHPHPQPPGHTLDDPEPGHGPHRHPHEHGQDVTSSVTIAHSHGGRFHTHSPIDPSLGWRSLLAIGFAGGLLPSPSALVVLIGAVALHRAWFGVLLVIAYGAGMAGMLTTAGLLLVRARGLLDRRRARNGASRYLASTTALLPMATSALITIVGVYLAARAWTQL